MSTDPGELSPSFLDVASQRAEQIERALSHVARAVELELASIALNPELLDDATKERFTRLGEQLVKISRGGDYLLGDIARTTGVQIETNAPYLLEPPTIPLRPATPEPMVEAPPAPIPPQPTRLAEEEVEQGAKGTATTEEGEPDKDDLYSKIIDLERVPTMAPKEDAPSVTISILNDNRLGVGQRSIALGGHELYLFNALMLLRDKARAAEELRAFNFAPSSSNGTAQIAFNKAMNSLSAQLNGAAGLEVIKRVGQARGTRYAVNPNLVLEDLRTEIDIIAENGASVKKK